MPLRLHELFGHVATSRTAAADHARRHRECPFLEDTCQKRFRDGEPSGVCTVRTTKGSTVVCCPIRLYARDYRVLHDVAVTCFGADVRLVQWYDRAKRDPAGRRNVVVFGKRWGKELRLPKRVGGGAYFVDWILALVDAQGDLEEFVAVEVQTIDTTGTYRPERDALMRGVSAPAPSVAGLNWENVNKRILPQLIYKGHVLRREQRCTKGLFFICPTPVIGKLFDRLGGRAELQSYAMHPGALTFSWYDLGPLDPATGQHDLVHGGRHTTTVDQVAQAFTSPRDLPPQGVYEAAIRIELR